MSLLPWIDESKIHIEHLIGHNDSPLKMAYLSKLGLRKLPLDIKEVIQSFLELPTFTYKIGKCLIKLDDSIYSNINFLEFISNNRNYIKSYDLDIKKIDTEVIIGHSWALPLLLEYPFLFESNGFMPCSRFLEPFLTLYPNYIARLNEYQEWALPLLEANTEKLTPFIISNYEWALDLIKRHPNLQDLNVLSQYEWAIDIIKENLDSININNLERGGIWALPLIESIVDKYPGLAYSLTKPWTIDLMRRHPGKLNYNFLSKKEWALPLLESNRDKINYYLISTYPWAISIIENNLPAINWDLLSANPAAVHLFEANASRITKSVSLNINAIDFMIRHSYKIDYELILKNKNAKPILFESSFCCQFEGGYNYSFDSDLLSDPDLAHILVSKLVSKVDVQSFLSLNANADEAIARELPNMDERLVECILEFTSDRELVMSIIDEISESQSFRKALSKNVNMIQVLIEFPNLVVWNIIVYNESYESSMFEFDHKFSDESLCRYDVLFPKFMIKWNKEQELKKKVFTFCSNPANIDKIATIEPEYISWEGVSINSAILI